MQCVLRITYQFDLPGRVYKRRVLVVPALTLQQLSYVKSVPEALRKCLPVSKVIRYVGNNLKYKNTMGLKLKKIKDARSCENACKVTAGFHLVESHGTPHDHDKRPEMVVFLGQCTRGPPEADHA